MFLQDVSGVLSEQDDWEDKYDKELCQEEETLIYSIWANPSFLEFYQDTHAGLQDGPCWLSSVGRGTSGDKARNLQGVSPVPEEHMDDKPAAAALTGAPVEEWYCASLATVGKEARKTPASPLLSEQPTAVAESQAAAPHSPIAYNMALQDTDDCKMREVLHEALPAIQELSQQLAEHGDPAQSVGVVMAAAPPAAPQDSEPPLSGEPQREPSTATESPAAHKDEVAPSLPQPPAPDDAALPHLEPAGDNKRDYMDSTLSAESWHQDVSGVLSEQDDWEDKYDKELCQEEETLIYSIWANPSFLEFYQDTHAGLQDGPCWLSSVGRGTSGDKARNLQGVSPVPEEHMDDKPAAAALTGAPVEEWYCASLATVGKEARKTPASPLLSEQPTAVAESQAAAPHSPIAYNMALQDTDDCKMREVLHEALPAIQELSQQLAEHGDPAQSVGVVMAAAPPAAPQDSEPPLSGEPQREPSTATESPAAHKDEVAPSLPQPPAPDDAALPHLEPAGDNKRDYMDSTLSAESWHQDVSGVLSEQDDWEDKYDKELCQEEETLIYSIWANPSFLDFYQDTHAGLQDGPCWLSSVGRGTSGDKARNLQGVSPVPEEHMDDKPAAAALTGAPVEEWYCASLATVGKEARKTPASPLLSEQPTAVAESQAAAPHSPIAYNMALQDTDDCKMREVLHEALPAIQELSQQLAEHGDPAQSVGVVMAAAPPAAPQDSEPPLSGEPQREPSTATESPAAHKDEVAPSLPQPPAPDDAALPHLEPAGDNKRDYMDSTLSAESWHQVSPGCIAGSDHHEVL
ncbi:uncharacterized protein LOC130143516 isoform X1 [Falco biarmicus]|uniref:uncharacterized protein LOC130143516 isoform X1 n=2 Tax=Falco biarmicus TaxID=345155 RepID=UPI0024BC5C3D|nr:uncharacterized protein LOC130143516 isoform X1 [Falco biarmicus]